VEGGSFAEMWIVLPTQSLRNSLTVDLLMRERCVSVRLSSGVDRFRLCGDGRGLGW
jgi:hypothetical protein